MFGRRFISRVIPLTFKILKPVHIYRIQAQYVSLIHIAPKISIPNVRRYAQEATTENMTADYEYVKKATTNKEILIVDVREPEEIKEHGKIPNSINIALGNVTMALSSMTEKEFQETYNRPLPKENTEIIFYCAIGKRSGMAQQNAFNIGYKNVKNYVGSWTDWASREQ